MSFRELDLKRSYISYGGDNIAQAFLTPALMHTKLYRRSVGFFSSNVITSIIDGIVLKYGIDNTLLVHHPTKNGILVCRTLQKIIE